VACNAALARIPVARREVVQHRHQAVRVQPVGDLVPVEGVGELEFHPAKARFRSRLEAREEG